MRILGREWDYIATDATEGSGGNDERMAFVFNTEKVWFRKVAGEVVLPDGQLIVSRKKLDKSVATRAPVQTEAAVRAGFEEVRQQFARTPFLVAFQSGWFRFSLCTVHIYYGEDIGRAAQRRIAEIERLVEFFADRQDRESRDEEKHRRLPENYILLGDFNVVSPEHETMAALKSEGFTVPAAIDGRNVRDEDDHFYDQIAVRVKDPRFRVVAGGIVDMFADGVPRRSRRHGGLRERRCRRRIPRGEARGDPAGALPQVADLADVRPCAALDRDRHRVQPRLPEAVCGRLGRVLMKRRRQ